MSGTRILLTAAWLASLAGGIALGADGKLSSEEYSAGREGERAERAQERFKKLDTDSDGAVTLKEFKEGFGKGRPEKRQQ